ncbi:MAG: hypothetical protein DVB31_02965 [Verrucomicrobia bacterium]|nr:MAG: hypothetical protein DVB31_02965 [Verrucomicrobiota bacterium]
MSSILNPVAEVRISAERTVTVREMAWPDALRFLQLLSGHVRALVKPMVSDGPIDRATVMRKIAEQLPEIVVGATDLGDFLLRKATDLDPAEIAGVRLCSALEILDKAIELNLGPEVIDRGKRVAGRLAGAFGATTTPMTEISMAGSGPSSSS